MSPSMQTQEQKSQFSATYNGLLLGNAISELTETGATVVRSNYTAHGAEALVAYEGKTYLVTIQEATQ